MHGAAHVRLALATGQPFRLLSAPGAASTLGVPWWRSLAEMAGQAEDILDCGVDAAAALAALRAGQRHLVLQGPFTDSVTAIAAAVGAIVLGCPPPAFDLAHHGAARRLASWLAEENAALPRIPTVES